MLGLDPVYFLIVGPGLVLGLLAAWRTKSTFAKYAQVGSRSGLTGAEAAQQMLARQGIYDVRINQTHGFLSDHYDPRTHSLYLSPDVFHGQSLSAIGVACHEAGHALQKAQGYPWMGVRAALVPITMFGQNLAPWIFAIGMGIGAIGLAKIGIALFAAAVVFSIVTLPVEWDASARAKLAMVSAGILTPQEQAHAGRVLNAAFMTYVAGAVTSVLTLVYFLFRAGLVGGNRRDD